MVTKKYPIGTKIRFINPYIDTGLTGKIVGLTMGWGPDIYLPMAEKHIKHGRFPILSNGAKFTWHCRWEEIEPISVKGQQLLFSFME